MVTRTLTALLVPALALALVAGVADSTSARSVETYTIEFYCKHVVGDKFRTVATWSDQTTEVQISPAREPTKRGATVTMTAVVEVTAVDDKGGITASTATIEACAIDARGMKLSIPAGTVLTARQEGDKTVLTDPSGKVDKAALSALERARLIKAADPKGSVKDLFEPAGPVAPGASWPVDPAKAAEVFTERQIIAKPADVKGQAKLVGATARAGVKGRVLTVETKMTVDPFTMARFPKDLTLVGAKMQSTITGSFPTDPRGPVLDMREDRVMSMTIKAQEGELQRVTESTMVRAMTVKNTRL